jgi:PAS domain S-box-containing protein
MHDKVNVLLVDDQPAKLLASEEILRGLGENLVKASSAREALEFLLKNEAAVVLIDVCMPELDGFQLAAMIRDHPRFQRTAIIFISAIQVEDVDRLRGYEMGAVDYVPVPVVPEVLRAKVKIFAELYRKTRDLERLNSELERRVAERTSELEASNARLLQSEEGRSLALAAGQMGSWDWGLISGEWKWDEGQHRIFGVDRESFRPTLQNIQAMIHPDDRARLQDIGRSMSKGARTQQAEFRVLRPDGSFRWCTGTAAASLDAADRVVRLSGVTTDITDRKEAEGLQVLLAREVDHRARNALAVVIDHPAHPERGDNWAAVEVDSDIQSARQRRQSGGTAPTWGAFAGEELRRIGSADADGVEVEGSHLAAALAGSGWRCCSELATNVAAAHVLNGGQGQPHLAAAAGASRAAVAGEGRSADCAAGHAQLRPERDPRQRGAAARRQGDVRLGSARAAMHALDPPRRTDQSAGTKTGARASRQRLRASEDGSQPPRSVGRR